VTFMAWGNINACLFLPKTAKRSSDIVLEFILQTQNWDVTNKFFIWMDSS
jgi:hypothetical protein